MYPEDRTAHNWLIKKSVNDKVRARLPALRGRVLDLGCGIRPFEADIRRHSSEYIGVDWSNSMHGNHADVVADLNRPLPIDSDSVDHVVSFEVLEHLCEPRVMLSESFRILRSGGQLTLSVPFQWWVHEEPWDYFRYTRTGFFICWKPLDSRTSRSHLQAASGQYGCLCLITSWRGSLVARGRFAYPCARS